MISQKHAIAFRLPILSDLGNSLPLPLDVGIPLVSLSIASDSALHFEGSSTLSVAYVKQMRAETKITNIAKIHFRKLNEHILFKLTLKEFKRLR